MNNWIQLKKHPMKKYLYRANRKNEQFIEMDQIIQEKNYQCELLQKDLQNMTVRNETLESQLEIDKVKLINNVMIKKFFQPSF
ncbi:hypothetical protein IMG5_160110 [Ichthyophthirius multifiliis]|uniref:Uncharacterized protein n=1 Tax=Ichthyophthirius multifiliis TaxID=5932 RepID=G0QZV9_ICHMU|nr:hypothetical protein IMG5_160110 [Ichthyophthirius multifiliis]EGR29254.1 hypothetical protein IMG5_160110 [Ichthyophthirius multifiliis]|eukprot:XP_004030490.1 hypothetical protein IMG5_160110 [Ichthyophthirius multifiliis]